MRDTPSGFFMARRLGTSSPKTSVKYESISVTSTTAMEFITEGLMPIPVETTALVMSPAKLVAAAALPR